MIRWAACVAVLVVGLHASGCAQSGETRVFVRVVGEDIPPLDYLYVAVTNVGVSAYVDINPPGDDRFALPTSFELILDSPAAGPITLQVGAWVGGLQVADGNATDLLHWRGLTRMEITLHAGTCGNDMVEPGEDCDGMDLQCATCADIPRDGGLFSGGTLRCNPDCTFDSTSCSAPGSDASVSGTDAGTGLGGDC
jgi:hypothetical protein